MSRRPQPQEVTTGPLGLPAPKQLPLDQLQQIQKRLQALINSTGQLQAEVAIAPTFDWQTILTRYGSLVSQLYSLTSALTSPTSAFIPAQQDALQKVLEEEGKNNNYFMRDDQEADNGFNDTAAIAALPRVRYTDEKNALPKLAATPIHALQGDKAARLGEALRTKLDPDVEAKYGEALEQDAATSADLSQTLAAVAHHDQLALRALRTWHHVRWRPDEAGQTYDFRMRLPDDDDGVLDDEEEGGDVEQQAPEIQQGIQVNPDEIAEEEVLEDYEDDEGADEEGDEEMEDVV
ncbi:unnamed protein product [Sympodiomycopsis kandeliae]